MYVFKGSPTIDETPCPGDVALVDGSCPTFECDAVDNPCLNNGICGADKTCTCAGTVSEGIFKGIDCALYECFDDNTGNSLRGIVNCSILTMSMDFDKNFSNWS